MKEEDIARAIIKYFEKDGYESYKEVLADIGSRRADMIFKKNDELIVVESKMNMGMNVIEQAYKWKSRTNIHKAFVAVSRPKRKRNLFAHQVCRDYGIGIFEVDKYGVTNLIMDSLVNNNISNEIDITLYEEQKDSVAGTKGGDYVTPFKLTCAKIYKELENGEMSLVDLVRNVEHHYSNDNSAKKCITEMCKVGVIKASVYKKGNIYYIKL